MSADESAIAWRYVDGTGNATTQPPDREKSRSTSSNHLAVEKYRTGDVSLNRAAEIAGLSTEEFKDALAERGIKREPGFLSEDDRDEELRKL